MATSRPLPVLSPDRIRQVPPSFAWIDHRLRSDGFLQRMTPDEVCLYFFLALASDRQGLSCWRLDRIERELLCMDIPSLREARDGLLRLKLLAYQPWAPRAHDGSYQLLALPPAPPPVPRSGPKPIAELLSDLRGLGR